MPLLLYSTLLQLLRETKTTLILLTSILLRDFSFHLFMSVFYLSILPSFDLSFIPYFLPFFISFYLPSILHPLLPSFLYLFLPTFYPSSLPTFLSPSLSTFLLSFILFLFIRFYIQCALLRFVVKRLQFCSTWLSYPLSLPLPQSSQQPGI